MAVTERARLRRPPAPDREEARDAPPAAALLRMQRVAGNAAVSGLLARLAVQRDGLVTAHVASEDEQADMPTSAETPALLAENQELYARKGRAEAAEKARKPVAEADRLSATEVARYQELDRRLKARFKGDEDETLRRNGQVGAAAWFADVKPMTFLGRAVTVHALLKARLVAVETALKSETPPAGGWLTEPPSSLRDPGQGLHSFGLAVDLNPGRNPYLLDPKRPTAALVEPTARSTKVRDVIDRAVLLVRHETATEADLPSRPAEADAAKRVEASYDKLRAASDALEEYLTLGAAEKKTVLDGHVTALRGKDPRTADQWAGQIAKDATTLAAQARPKKWSQPETGFLHLDKRLVTAMTGDGGLTWLGDDTIASGRDIMHFDTRGVGPVRTIFSSLTGRWTHLGNG